MRKSDEVASRASSTRTEHRERLKRSPCLRQGLEYPDLTRRLKSLSVAERSLARSWMGAATLVTSMWIVRLVRTEADNEKYATFSNQITKYIINHHGRPSELSHVRE